MDDSEGRAAALRGHEIAEAGHRILNPFDDAKLDLLGAVCRPRPGWRLLDLACGKGELLCRWAARYGTRGLGVDLSEVFLAGARARAAELGVTDRVEFRHGDAAEAVRDGVGVGYDVVACVGATWIGGGLAGTVELLRPAMRPDGLMLIGEPYWADDTPDEAYAGLGLDRDEFTTLPGTLDRLEAAGLRLVEMVLADGDSWDRYVAEQWWALDRWLASHPADHPDVPLVRDYLAASQRGHLRWQRRYLGWGVFVLRAARPA